MNVLENIFKSFEVDGKKYSEVRVDGKIRWVFERDHSRPFFFIKVPCGKASFALLENEYSRLSSLTELKFNRLAFPEIGYFDETKKVLAVSNIKPKNYFSVLRKKNLSLLHCQALFELYQQTKKVVFFKNTEFYRNEVCALRDFSYQLDSKVPESVFNALQANLSALEKQLADSEMVATMGHCDFTPWNMYEGWDKLYVYDWELARLDVPILFDVFHYIYQKRILLDHCEYSEIQSELYKLKQEKKFSHFLQKNNLSFNCYHALYLLCNVSYYLPRYVEQEDLHMQANWLLHIWSQALGDVQLLESDFYFLG